MFAICYFKHFIQSLIVCACQWRDLQYARGLTHIQNKRKINGQLQTFRLNAKSIAFTTQNRLFKAKQKASSQEKKQSEKSRHEQKKKVTKTKTNFRFFVHKIH